MGLSPAVILSGHTMALGVTRALGGMGVPIVSVHHDPRDMAHFSKFVVEEIPAPHPAKYEDAYIELLLQLAKRFGNSLLIPTSDETLTIVSKHKETLAMHFIVACTDWDITQKFINKKHTHLLAVRAGVPVPRTVVPQSRAEVERYLESIEFPCLVKPCQGHLYYEQFKRKMTTAENPDELLSAYLQATERGLEVMLQEIIPGDDSLGANYNAYFWDDRPLAEFTAQQLRNAPPSFGSPRVVVSEEIPEVIEPGRRILRALGFYGYACTEFKKDPRDGVYKLMEVNGRHNLSTLLAVRCGINFPWLQYQHLVMGQTPSASAPLRHVYWIDITRDIGYSLMYLPHERLSLAQFLRPYLGQRVCAIFSLRDPKPFIKRLAYLITQAALTLLSRVQRKQPVVTDTSKVYSA